MSQKNEPSQNLVRIQELVYAQKPVFSAVSSDTGIVFEREAGFAMQLFSANKYLSEVAMGNRESVIAAITNISAIGISLNPASKLAYLIPRKGKICLDISYMGLMHLAQQTGAIKWGQAIIVRENDEFSLTGIDSPPIHKFNPFGRDRGAITGCYLIVKTDSDDYLTHAMPIDKIYDIRNRTSESWKTKSGAWVTDEEEMIKKTVVKQASKYWPRRERLDTAVHYLNTEGGEGVGADEVDVTPITAEQAASIAALIIEVQADKAAFLRFAKAESVETILASNYDGVVAALEKKRKKALADEDFEAKKAEWKSLVAEGTRTAENLILMLKMKSILTDAQCDEIESWEYVK